MSWNNTCIVRQRSQYRNREEKQKNVSRYKVQYSSVEAKHLLYSELTRGVQVAHTQFKIATEQSINHTIRLTNTLLLLQNNVSNSNPLIKAAAILSYKLPAIPKTCYI